MSEEHDVTGYDDTEDDQGIEQVPAIPAVTHFLRLQR
jgi:hypothetical protein